MKKTAFSANKLVYPGLLTVLWVVAALVVNPLGEFPLNDDFSFSRTVFNLSEKGMLAFDEWLSMTLLTQLGWGAAFTKLFGFSFTALRLSTLLIGWLGLLTLFTLLRKRGHSNHLAFLATLTLAFNPLFFSLSYTFMTDVPFLCCCLFSIFFFHQYFADNKWRWFFWAIFLALAATFIRQLGLMLPAAFAIAVLFKNKLSIRSILIGLFPLFVTVILLSIYQSWFSEKYGLPETFGSFSKLFKRIGDKGFLLVCTERIGLLLIYAGLFLLPVNILIFNKKMWKKRFYSKAFCVALSIVTIWTVYDRFPWGNIFYNFGLGPKTLKDGIYFLNISPTLSKGGLLFLVMIGTIGSILLIFNLIDNLMNNWNKKNQFNNFSVFILVNIILYGGFLMLDVYFFDRYFLPFLLFVLLIVLPSEKTTERYYFIKRILAVSAFLILLLFSVLATHDYLSWNKSRWKALNYLTHDKKISLHLIDGGFEFNGWHRPGILEHGKSKSWWWVDRDDYVISFGDLNGYEKEKAFPFVRLLPPSKDSIYILKKKADYK